MNRVERMLGNLSNGARLAESRRGGNLRRNVVLGIVAASLASLSILWWNTALLRDVNPEPAVTMEKAAEKLKRETNPHVEIIQQKAAVPKQAQPEVESEIMQMKKALMVLERNLKTQQKKS